MGFGSEHLDAVIRDGLVADIFRVERAQSILTAIGDRANDINGRDGEFASLFGALQAALTTEAVMAVARVFDRPNSRYPTRCVVGVLCHLRKNAADYASIREPDQLTLALRAMQAPESLEACAHKTPALFPCQFADFVESLLDEPSRRQSLDKLRDLRDKGLAHSEHVEKVVGPTWTAIAELTEIAKRFVGVLGWAYLSWAYVVDGKYVLSADARRPSMLVEPAVDRLCSDKHAT